MLSLFTNLLLFLSLLIGLCNCRVTTTNEEVQTLNTNTHFNPQVPPLRTLSSSKRFEGSSEFVKLKYHMGPVLSSPINIYLIWYGKWPQSQKLLIKDFLNSISDDHHRASPSPSVSDWWRTVSLYTDQTGANISRSVSIAGEYSDLRYSHGTHLTRLSVQDVIATAVQAKPFPVDHRNGIYLILTAEDVTMEDFCRAVCGFHYFTFPSKVGYTLPYAWVGNSGKQCPEVCAYPFAVPDKVINGENATNSSNTAEAKSPRLQKKFGLERRSRPTSPSSDLSSNRRQHNRQSGELSSSSTTPRQKFSEISNQRRDFRHEVVVEVIHTVHSDRINGNSTQLKGMNQNNAAEELSKESFMAEKTITAEQPSPVSVLDASFYREEPPSPVKKKSDMSKDLDDALNTYDSSEENSENLQLSSST